MSLNCRTLTLPDLAALPLWDPTWKGRHWVLSTLNPALSYSQLHWGILGKWKLLISFFWNPDLVLHLKNVYCWSPATKSEYCRDTVTKVNIANPYLEHSIIFKSRSQGLDLILDTWNSDGQVTYYLMWCHCLIWWRQIRDDCAVLWMTRILTFLIITVIIIIIIIISMSTLIITIIVIIITYTV